jgi:integrase
MVEYNQLISSERKEEWAKAFLKRLEELTKTDSSEVKIPFYYRDNKRLRQEHILLRENLKSIVDYIKFKMANGEAKILSAGIQANYLIYFCKDVKKPFKDITREDIEKFFQDDEKSERYKLNFRTLFKTFFRWFYHIEKEDGYPDIVKWIKCKSINGKLPKILTTEEIGKMIEVCDNLRDRAIISVLYESGCRAGELLGLKIEGVTFDEYGAVIIVDGKTGMRRIRLISSVVDLKNWLNIHPRKNDTNAPLFCAMTKNTKGNPLGASTLGFIIGDLAKKAGIEKRIYPHLFRHSRATHLAKNLSDQELKVYFGWVGESSMPSIYVHLSGKDIDNKILEINGIKHGDKNDISKIPTIKCLSCDEVNSIGNKFCIKCGKPLSAEITENERIKEAVIQILPKLIEMANRGELKPEDMEIFKPTVKIEEKHP